MLQILSMCVCVCWVLLCSTLPHLYTELMAVANPKSVKVNVTTGTGMDIEWDDGHRTHYTFQWLRDACPCATCNEEREQQGRKAGEPEKRPATLLPMFKEPPKPTEVKPVGRYALNIIWNDGHSSGIYSWDYLRAMCQCEECSTSGDRRDRVTQ